MGDFHPHLFRFLAFATEPLCSFLDFQSVHRVLSIQSRLLLDQSRNDQQEHPPIAVLAERLLPAWQRPAKTATIFQRGAYDRLLCVCFVFVSIPPSLLRAS
jgi:hypothetical protein